MFTPLVVLFFMREGLAWRGSRSLPIVIITFIIRGQVRARMRSPSLCMAHLSLQVVYLSLHGLFIVLSLGYVTAHTRMTSASLSGVYTSLSLETFHSLHFDHTQGWESYPAVGI